MLSEKAGPVPNLEATRGLMGSAVLALWGNADPEMEEGFNDWYTHEHLPERIGIPGFLRARRYVSCPSDERAAHSKYLTLYEVQTIEILMSEAYITMLNNPTPQTRRFLPMFRRMSRTACTVTYSKARGMGGNAALVEFGPKPGEENRLRNWVVSSLASNNMTRSGCLAVHFCEVTDIATDLARNVEAYKNLPPTNGRWIVMIEGGWPDPAAALEDRLRDIEGLEENGALPDYSYGMYRLLVSLAVGDM